MRVLECLTAEMGTMRPLMPLNLALVVAMIAFVQEQNAEDHMRRARALELSGNLDDALASYDAVVEQYPEDWRGAMLRGQLRFRLGENEGALSDFDRVVELAPDQEPYLWQRGISQYYAGDDTACLRQFERHRTVNPNDVENAVWHFLCLARKDGIDEARAGMLPVGPDPRAPMGTIYRMFAGEASVEDVRESASRAGSPSADFYADLYIGLYLEASGQTNDALTHVRAAAEAADRFGYMGDVARFHLGMLALR